MARLVVFDMDGVLADVESSWVHVHRHFGVNNDHSLYAYLRGEIDDLEFIRRDILLWKDEDPSVNEGTIRGILAGVELMPGAKETVSRLRDAGLKTAIVSAGIDLLAERIAEELGMDAQLANGLVTDGAGRLTGEGILRVRLMDKGDAVTAMAQRFGADRSEVVSIGNSRYDISMFKRSGRGIAFRPMDDDIRNSADAVVNLKDLRHVLTHLSTTSR